MLDSTVKGGDGETGEDSGEAVGVGGMKERGKSSLEKTRSALQIIFENERRQDDGQQDR